APLAWTGRFTSRTGTTSGRHTLTPSTRGTAAMDAFIESSCRGTRAARVRLRTARLQDRWTFQSCRAKQVAPTIQQRLVASARAERSPVVRSQLACSAKRLPGKDALPIIRELLQRDEDAVDPQIPLLIWWAIESKAVSDRDQVVGLFS